MKTLNVVCKDDEQIERLRKFKTEDEDALNRVLSTGYAEGEKDGVISGYLYAGLTLVAAAGLCKLMNFLKKK